MKMYLVSLPSQKAIIELFGKACNSRGIPLEVLNPDDVATVDIKVEPGDIVYRASTAVHYGSLELEKYLISKGATSFYRNNDLFLLGAKNIDTILLESFGVEVPKTIDYIPKDKNAILRCVDYLGGFPIIIKALGGSHGVGVIRVDSLPGLFSVGDYLREQGGMYVMKEYCNVTSTARLIVLGDKVIDSIKYTANKGDFRSNEGAKPNVSVEKFSAEVENVAIKATHVLGLEFGGVDVMITENGPKVAEVNFPCFFPRCQLLTGTDIAGQMVDYLIAKR